jgi:hypothetical protein
MYVKISFGMVQSCDLMRTQMEFVTLDSKSPENSTNLRRWQYSRVRERMAAKTATTWGFTPLPDGKLKG